MSLPTRATLEDLEAVCAYLVTKPTGATLAEARAVVDSKRLDGRKLAALRFWGVIENDGTKMKITDTGRRLVRDSGSTRSEVLREVVSQVPAYVAVIERAALGGELTVAVTEVASHWHEHFRSDVSDSDTILNSQALCFFHVAQAADLGRITLGRKGRSTRFDFDAAAVRTFVKGSTEESSGGTPAEGTAEVDDPAATEAVSLGERAEDDTATQSNRVFITHGKNRQILNQVKELVVYGKFEPVIAIEHETAAKPVPLKVMGDMRTCRAAVIHVGAEGLLYDLEGNEVPQINENVLIEVGAAMALYGDRFVLLVEEGVNLPSNLQGLYECRYKGDELSMQAVMKLLKAFNEF